MNKRDDQLKIFALITARGGSKRLPNKNILPLAHKPLIAWTIDSAKQAFSTADIIVSTDSESIAEVARAHGATVPWLRPAHLASDTATSVDVVLHALDWYERQSGPADGILLLQPTSPFRHPDAIPALIRQFIGNGRKPVVSVSPAANHPMWTFKLDQGRLRSYMGQEGMCKRSQDLQPAYALNGSLYLVSPQDLRDKRSLVTDETEAYVMEDPVHAVDIDTAFDFTFAELLAGSDPALAL